MVRNEKTAVETYVSLMSHAHKDFQVKYCGMLVDNEHHLISCVSVLKIVSV